MKILKSQLLEANYSYWKLIILSSRIQEVDHMFQSLSPCCLDKIQVKIPIIDDKNPDTTNVTKATRKITQFQKPNI